MKPENEAEVRSWLDTLKRAIFAYGAFCICANIYDKYEQYKDVKAKTQYERKAIIDQDLAAEIVDQHYKANKNRK